jgi:hypothetical protein
VIYTPEPGMSAEEMEMLAATNKNFAGSSSDTILYLGPKKSMTACPKAPDIYLDSAFRKEVERRTQIMTGKPPTDFLPPFLPDSNTASPTSYW